MAALENTLKMGTWMFLLLGFFLVPRSHCDTSAVNKTELLLDELDNLLVQVTQYHVDMYVNSRKCLSSSQAVEENYRSNENGIILLANVLYRYNLLTQMYNYGCKKPENENLSSIMRTANCEPFGCHKIEMRYASDQPPSGSHMRQRSDHVNVNNITVVVNYPNQPTIQPTEEDEGEWIDIDSLFNTAPKREWEEEKKKKKGRRKSRGWLWDWDWF